MPGSTILLRCLYQRQCNPKRALHVRELLLLMLYGARIDALSGRQAELTGKLFYIALISCKLVNLVMDRLLLT